MEEAGKRGWEMDVGTRAVSPGERGAAAQPPGPGRRWWLAVAGLALVTVSLAPPVVTLARTHVFAASIQFAVFAIAGPALIVSGAPWRVLRLRAAAGRLAGRRQHRTSFLRACTFLLAFMGVSLSWRLPPVMDALARHPALVAAEAVTLLPAGAGLWLELVDSPPLKPRLPHPQRAFIAALAMWSTWAVAYVLGLSTGAVLHAYDTTGSALGVVADQEISVGLVWAVTSVCFVPVIYAAVFAWLRDTDDPGGESRRIAGDQGQRPAVRGWGRVTVPRGQRPGPG